jgi:putative membrane protein
VNRRWLPPVLLGLFAILWTWAAIDPLHRFDWFLENLLVFLCLPLLVWAQRRGVFSDTALLLLFLFSAMHVVGSKWTYSNVPWPDWQALGFERNHYDRIVHFCYGFLLVVPFAEVYRRRGHGQGWVSAVQFVLASSAFYEILEWATVAVVNPAAGAAFLGAQGDEFDAVKDMALAGGGAALTATGLAVARRLRRPRAAPSSQA